MNNQDLDQNEMVFDRSADIAPANRSAALAFVASGLLGMLAAIPLSAIIFLVNARFPGQLEKTVAILGGIFIILSVSAPGIYLLQQRRFADPRVLGWLALTGGSIVLVSTYLYWVSFYVRFPADILIWSESDFVNDILKFRVGYPIFSAQQNNDSFPYMPGTQLLTFFLAWLSGNGLSIPAYRAIQVGFTLGAAVIGVGCVSQLIALAQPNRRVHGWDWSGTFYLPMLFLFATNALTNPFVHNLHNDALAQLISVVAYALLLKYATNPSPRTLFLMALIAPLGFLVKQNLVVWAVFYVGYLIVFDQPRSMRRVVAFAVLTFGSVGAVFGLCYLLWGTHYIYWTITVLANHTMSLLRSAQHVLDVWAYFTMGLVGGAILLRGKHFNRLLGPWLVWLGLILIETWSSGIAWMINHIGPGSLIAGIWFLAGLHRLGLAMHQPTPRALPLRLWFRVGIGVAVVAFFFSELGIIRLPLQPFGDAPYKYIAAIEQEFVGQASKDILLDMGTWVYVQDGVIMKDRAPTIGERGYSDTGDFSEMIRRLEEKRYTKILIRNLHRADLWYEYATWHKPSGIRQALLANYHEIGKIPAVAESNPGWLLTYGFSEISILVPNPK